MARLPDAQALGGRPTPSPRGGVISGPSNAGLPESVEARDATKGVVEFADQLAKAGERIQRRRDAVEHANNLGEYEDFATEELRRTSLEEDVSRQEVLAGLGDRLRQKKTEILSRATSSPDGMARLEADLEKTRVTHSIQAAGIARTQESKKINLRMGQHINELSSEYLSDIGNPQKLAEVFGRLDQKVAAYAGALEPQEEIQFRQVGRSMIVYSALAMLAEKNPNAAEDVLRDTPGISKILSSEHQVGILKTIGTARTAANKPIVLPEGSRLVSGTGKTIAEGSPKREPLQLKEIAVTVDRENPTGRKWVTEQEAVGKPAPQPQPLFSTEETYAGRFAKGLAESDQKILENVNKNEELARRNLAEISVTKSALQSGKFETGSLATPRVMVGKFLQLTGMATDETKKLTGDTATADVLDRASKRLAVDLANNLSRVTNMSLGFIEESLPGLSRTPEGNAVIADIMERISKRDIQIATIKDDYIAKYGNFVPKDGSPTFTQRIRNLDEIDPVITSELKQRIIDMGNTAPKSWLDMYDKSALPPNVKQRQGLDVLGVRDGKIWFQRKSDKKKFSEPLSVYQSEN